MHGVAELGPIADPTHHRAFLWGDPKVPLNVRRPRIKLALQRAEAKRLLGLHLDRVLRRTYVTDQPAGFGAHAAGAKFIRQKLSHLRVQLLDRLIRQRLFGEHGPLQIDERRVLGQPKQQLLKGGIRHGVLIGSAAVERGTEVSTQTQQSGRRGRFVIRGAGDKFKYPLTSVRGPVARLRCIFWLVRGVRCLIFQLGVGLRRFGVNGLPRQPPHDLFDPCGDPRVVGNSPPVVSGDHRTYHSRSRSGQHQWRQFEQ